MPDNSIPENNVPEKRPSRFRQFGLRTLLLLVALAALGCLFVRNEMLREERRETLIAELEAQGTLIEPFSPPYVPRPPFWRQPLAARLRGKPMVEPRMNVRFAKEASPRQISEFVDLFPNLLNVDLHGDAAMPEVLRSLASGAFVRFKSPLAIDKETARLIAKISEKCEGGLMFENQDFSDAELKNLADAGVNSHFISTDDFWRNLSDEGLKAVAKSPINSAIHACCLGTDDGIRALTSNPSIELLYMTGPNYTDASVDVIPTLPTLFHLSFAWTNHTDAGMAKAIASCNPYDITFDNVALSDETLTALAKDARLRNVVIKGIDLSLEQCDALAKLPIRRLTIHNKNLSDDKIASLAALAASLESFDLKAPQVTDTGLAWLKEAPRLTELHLVDTQATAATWSALSKLGQVGMGGSNFSADMIVSTSDMFRLNGLSLTGSKVDDAVIELMPPQHGLYNLRLIDTQITPDGMKKLAQKVDARHIVVIRESDAPSLITEADIKEAQASARPGVEFYYEVSAYRCE